MNTHTPNGMFEHKGEGAGHARCSNNVLYTWRTSLQCTILS